jgi:hypothetical protein
MRRRKSFLPFADRWNAGDAHYRSRWTSAISITRGDASTRQGILSCRQLQLKMLGWKPSKIPWAINLDPTVAWYYGELGSRSIARTTG